MTKRTAAAHVGCRTGAVPSRPRARRASGFTLVEIAVVLVIIGLLLGAILQGQQLIASSRVQNLADQQAGIQAAYFGFIDRYGAVPGDMDRAEADDAIGEDINQGGNANGRLAPPEGKSADGDDPDWSELNAVWEHLSKAGFIRGSFDGGEGDKPDSPNDDSAPQNAFNSIVLLARHDGYEGGDSDRLLYHFGQNVPASIARELDEKLDDGSPDSGSLRNGSDGTANFWGSNADCSDDDIWDIETDIQNCNPVFIF